MHSEAQAQDRFTGPMYRRLWIPAMTSALGWALSDMADAVVVGQKMGVVGPAAISLILPVYMFNCMFAHGLGLGGSVRYSRLLGEGKTEEAKNSWTAVFAMTLLLSCATTILGTAFITPLLRLLGTVPADGALFEATRDYLRIQLLATPLFYCANVLNYYLRNDGSQSRAGLGAVIGYACDIALNFMLVLGFGLGTAGAALSTALGQIIAIGIYIPGFFLSDHVLRFTLPKTSGWLADAASMLRAGLATSVQYLYQTIFFLLCNNLLIRMGGEVGVAVFDIIQNTSYLILYLYEGTARAMQPILSTYHGERNMPGQKTLLWIGFASGIATGGSMVLLVALWPKGICALFGIAGSEAEALAVSALRIYALGAFFAGLNILLSNYFQACEDEKTAFLIATLRGVVLLLPGTIFFARLDLSGFWWLFPFAEMGTTVLVSLLFLTQLSRGKDLLRMPIDEERIFRRTILSTSTDVGAASADLEAFCERWDAEARQQYTVMMTVEELGLAILKFGFHGRKDGYIQITVIAQESGDFELHLRDDAVTFDPFSVETKTLDQTGDTDEALDTVGLLMIKKRAKEFQYRRYQGFNSLIVKI